MHFNFIKDNQLLRKSTYKIITKKYLQDYYKKVPEGSDTFQWLVIERDRVGGLRLII